MHYTQIVFSPTGGTAKVAQAIMQPWSADIQTIDLCNGTDDFSSYTFQPDDMVLIALPSYGGRVPALASERLAQIHGNGASCTLVCVYGNRAYEDTLVEMEDLATQCGFTVLAAISAVAEHSIIHQYAAGRPDQQDLQTLQNYAGKIFEKRNAFQKTAPLNLPGSRPYKKAGAGGLVPKADKNCVRCGLCAEQCPAGAIRKENIETADPKKCISCMRCAVKCPHSARKANSVMVSAAALAIKKACSVRKECELFI